MENVIFTKFKKKWGGSIFEGRALDDNLSIKLNWPNQNHLMFPFDWMMTYHSFF
jgi:hypothetical protein